MPVPKSIPGVTCLHGEAALAEVLRGNEILAVIGGSRCGGEHPVDAARGY